MPMLSSISPSPVEVALTLSSISPCYVTVLLIGKVSSSMSSFEIIFNFKLSRLLSTYEEATVVAASTYASSESIDDLDLLFSLNIDIGGKPLSTWSFILSESGLVKVMLSNSEDFRATLLTNV